MDEQGLMADVRRDGDRVILSTINMETGDTAVIKFDAVPARHIGLALIAMAAEVTEPST